MRTFPRNLRTRCSSDLLAFRWKLGLDIYNRRKSSAPDQFTSSEKWNFDVQSFVKATKSLLKRSTDFSSKKKQRSWPIYKFWKMKFQCAIFRECSEIAARVIYWHFAWNWVWIFINKEKAALLTDLQVLKNLFSMCTFPRNLRTRCLSDLSTFR